MIGIDTNILARYIVQDDEEQARLASLLLEEELDEQNQGLVSAVVLCELVWVLRRAYGYGKEQVEEVLQAAAQHAGDAHGLTELDEATELDDGDPDELAPEYLGLTRSLKNLNVLGGCCGTDHRHVARICASVNA